MPTEKQVEQFIKLIKKNRTVYYQGFTKLDDPAWIVPLRERGFFTSPPPPIERDGGVMAPGWAESEYLARVADRAPDEVAATILNLPPTENPRVHADAARAAAKMPATAALKVAKSERLWMRERDALMFDYPSAAGALAAHLAEMGESDGALAFLDELLVLCTVGEERVWGPTLTPKFDQWSYSEILKKQMPAVVAGVGAGAFDLLLARLTQVSADAASGEPPRDYSDIWRPAIEDHSQNVRADVRDDIVDAVRDLSLSWIGQDASRAEEILDLLAAGEWDVFQRLRFYLLAQRAALLPELAIQAALDERLFYNEALVHERAALMSSVLPLMSEENIATWTELLDRGPNWPPRDPRDRDDDMDDERYDRSVAYWRLGRLAPLREILPPHLLADLDALEEEYGPADHPTFHSFTQGWTGPTSPKSSAELAAMEPREVVAFLTSWEPSTDMMTPTPEGLGRLLVDRVATSGLAFTELAAAGALDEHDPTYVRAVLSGAEKAIKDDGETELNWDGVFTLITLSLDEPQHEHAGRPAEDRDPDWSWCRKQGASLLETAISKRAIPTDRVDPTWDLIDALSWDPEPTLDYEAQYGGTNMDPLTLSLNTVRGQGMHAVLEFAVWKRQIEPGGVSTLAEMPAVADNLAKHLDPELDPSETTRGVLGSRLPQLQWIDSAWLTDHLEQLFPDDARLRLATWESYLAWGRPNKPLFEMLRPQYTRASRELDENRDRASRAGKSPAFALAEHLVLAYLWGVLSLDESDALGEYLKNAATDEVGHLVSFAGHVLRDNQLEPETLETLRPLWDAVHEHVKDWAPDDRSSALAGFGLWYSSGDLDPEWADHVLLELIRSGVSFRPLTFVGERIASRAADDMTSALLLVSAIVDSADDDWTLYAVRDEFRRILETALGSDNDNARATAEQIVHALGAKGFLDFGSLLDR